MRVCLRAGVCVHGCVVSVIVKHPVLPPSVVDGCSRNPLYYSSSSCGDDSVAQWVPHRGPPSPTHLPCVRLLHWQ